MSLLSEVWRQMDKARHSRKIRIYRCNVCHAEFDYLPLGEKLHSEFCPLCGKGKLKQRWVED